DSLWSLPLSFEETIKGANEGLKKQLTDQLAQDQFLPVGEGYVRSTVGATGKTELQVLPGYNFFQYIKPTKLPELRDSNNRAWDLTDYKALSEEGAPTTTELQSMVKLAREQMNQDFKKTYDPENPVNRETATLAFDPVAAAKVFQAGQAALQRLLTDPKSALEYAQADDEGKASMRESAMNSGFLVGPTEGGAFGDHHFGQFYLILKMKEKYNEAKAEGEALKGDGFSNAMGSAVSIATGGIISANAATKFLHENKDTINTITTVAAVIAAPFTGGASLLALAAYNGIQGAYNGGVLGAITAAGNAYTSQFGVTTSYTYADGFGASVGYKLGGLVDVGVSYSEKSGFGVSAGVTVGGISAGISYSQEGGFGANVGIKTASGVGMKLSYQDGQGISASLDYKQGNRANGFQSSISYGQNGFSGQVGMAKEGIGRAGLNFSQADGVGVYAGKTLGSGPLGGITSAEIGWNQAKGAQASYGSDTTRVTFSQKDGFGAKFSQDIGFGTVDLAISQRGGFEGSLSGSYNGIKGNLSFSSKEGFSASVSGSLNGKDYNLGINDKGKLSFNESVSVEKGQESLFINSMDELQGMNDQDIAAAKEKIAAKSFEAYQDEMIALNPELKDLKNDPEKFQAKIKELDESGDLKKPAKGNKDAAVDTGDSRDSVFSKVGGYFADLGSSFLGTSVSSGMGFVDENGTFHQRTCFVAGTLVHTKDGLKKIEEIQVGDVVLSKSDVSGEMSYRRVVNTFVRQADLIYKVSFADGTVLETTWNHPFRTQKAGSEGLEFKVDNTKWTQAKDLVVGDVTLTVEGDILKVTSILIDQREEAVYNFEVETNHTYFVGEVGVWVHNADYEKIAMDACRYNGVCDSITIRVTNPDGSSEELKFKNSTNANAAVYMAENGDTLALGADGKYYRNHKDQFGNNITTTLNGSLDEEQELRINGELLQDGGIVKMGSNGKMIVVSPDEVEKGATIFNNGMNANGSSALWYMQTTIRDTVRGNSYLVFNGTEGAYTDYAERISTQQNTAEHPVNQVIERSEDTLFNLARKGKIGTLITYSQGTLNAGRALSRAALDQGNAANLRNISWVSLGGAHNGEVIPQGIGEAFFYRNGDDQLSNNAPLPSYSKATRTAAEQGENYQSIVMPNTNCSRFSPRCPHGLWNYQNSLQDYYGRRRPQ
ncbi:polymorphic toxin-type HINT domain-containing protein, partial [Leptospira yasudae]